MGTRNYDEWAVSDVDRKSDKEKIISKSENDKVDLNPLDYCSLCDCDECNYLYSGEDDDSEV